MNTTPQTLVDKIWNRHVIAPELGIALPGCTLVCGDSHTATNGGLGALAWGIGTTEVMHVIATQALLQRKPGMMRISFNGAIGPGVYAKDLILYFMARYGVAAGTGCAVEYAGPAVRALPVEARMTICNMSVELGARFGIVAPDDAVISYVAQRPYTPKGALWERAVAEWRTLVSDAGAPFEREFEIDCNRIGPQVTWGNSPQEAVAIDERLPDPAAIADTARRQALEHAREPQITVDLERCVVHGLDGRTISFTVPAERRTALLAGLDEIDVILGMEAEIDNFQRADREQRPWIYLERT